MSMTITGIRNNVQALLEDTGKFATVLSHEPTDDVKFAGYPSASHYYAGSESGYATVSQNRRVYEYVVELYLVTNEATTAETEYGEVYALIDDIVQMFDESIDLSSSALSLSPACDIMRPTPSDLQRVRLDEGPGFVATIRLFCESDISFRNA